MDELIERLRSVNWEVIDDFDRMPDDPTQKCVFVDMRPDEFRALLEEAAAALEAARVDAERLDWLDANGSAVRLKGNSRRNLIIWGAVHVPSYRTIRHAIDHARGEEEGK